MSLAVALADVTTTLPAGGGSGGFTAGAAALAVVAGGAYELARRGRLFAADR